MITYISQKTTCYLPPSPSTISDSLSIIELKNDLMNGVGDSLVDITAFEDVNLDEGYGNSSSASSSQPSSNIVHQNMIKR